MATRTSVAVCVYYNGKNKPPGIRVRPAVDQYSTLSKGVPLEKSSIVRCLVLKDAQRTASCWDVEAVARAAFELGRQFEQKKESIHPGTNPPLR